MIIESFGLLILISGISGFIAWFICHHLPKRVVLLACVLSFIVVLVTPIILFENNLILPGYFAWTIGGGATMGILAAIDRSQPFRERRAESEN